MIFCFINIGSHTIFGTKILRSIAQKGKIMKKAKFLALGLACLITAGAFSAKPLMSIFAVKKTVNATATIDTLGITVTKTSRDAKDRTANPGSNETLIPGGTFAYAYDITQTGGVDADVAEVTKITISGGTEAFDSDDEGIIRLLNGSTEINSDTNVSKAVVKSADNKTMTITYLTAPYKFDRSKTASRNYTVDFNSNAGEHFQDCDIAVTTSVYAVQETGNADNHVTLNTDGTITTAGDWQSVMIG